MKNNINNNKFNIVVFITHNCFFRILCLVLLLSLFFSVFKIHISISDESEKNEEITDNKDGDVDDVLIKQLYCQYDDSISFEKAIGGLRLYIPTNNGYINYNIVHSVNSDINADIWRIGQAYACDDNLENEFPITSVGAEWDMALKLSGRDDFIGGYAHGDEKYTSLTMSIDGKQVDITSIDKLTSFKEITIVENSVGYDPNDHTTKALNHYKEYVINTNGITLNQKVEWLNDYTLSSSYLAMMPPLKTLTDTFYTDIDYTPKVANENYGSYSEATKAVVYGTDFRFMMSVPEYPDLQGGNRFLLTDNGGGTYNKMYFVICDGESVSAGDIWETTTCYQIQRG